MKDLVHSEHKFISDLALKGAKKTVIAEKIGCSQRSVYASLHRTFPAEGPSVTSTRKRRTGAYKVDAQTLERVNQFVLNHRWATNKEIIRECGLQTRHKTTVSRWLRKLSIGSFIACRRQGITPINVQKR